MLKTQSRPCTNKNNNNVKQIVKGFMFWLLCVCFTVQKREEYSNQISSKLEFNGGIYCLEKECLHFSLCAKLACCRCVLHAAQHCCEEGLRLKRRDMNEEEDWDEKKDIHPGNASKQEDVASFSHDPFKVKKHTVFFTSCGNSQSFVHFIPHQNCNQSLGASRMVS